RRLAEDQLARAGEALGIEDAASRTRQVEVLGPRVLVDAAAVEVEDGAGGTEDGDHETPPEVLVAGTLAQHAERLEPLPLGLSRLALVAQRKAQRAVGEAQPEVPRRFLADQTRGGVGGGLRARQRR